MVGRVAVVNHLGARDRRRWRIATGGAVRAAPGEGIVMAADEARDAGRVGIGVRRVRARDPHEGGGRVALGAGVFDAVAEAALDEPAAVLRPGGEAVVDDLDLVREEHRQRRKERRGSAVKAT